MNSENENPYLSVVVTSRNDGHGGDLLYRMQTFTDGFLNQCNKLDFPAELIFVDWNPPEDKPKIAEAINWPSTSPKCKIRVIEVPPEYHNKFNHADQLPLFQMIDELVKFIKSKKLNEFFSYRVDRFDVPPKIEGKKIDDQLIFCKKNTYRVAAREGTINLTGKLAKFSLRYPIIFGLFTVISSKLNRVYRMSPLWLIPFMFKNFDEFRFQADIYLMKVKNRITRNSGIRLIEKLFILIRLAFTNFTEFRLKMKVYSLKINQKIKNNFMTQLFSQLHIDYLFRLIKSIIKNLLLVLNKTYHLTPVWLFPLLIRDKKKFTLQLDIYTIRIRSIFSFYYLSELLKRWYHRSPFWLIPLLFRDRLEFQKQSEIYYNKIKRKIRNLSALLYDRGKLLFKLPNLLLDTFSEFIKHKFEELQANLIRQKAKKLHTNACGDFTLLSKKKWFELKGYPELEMYSFHIDSLFLYMAHYLGIREKFLHHPIYHLDHSGGWAPEKENELFTKMKSKGIPVMNYSELLNWERKMNRTLKPIIFNNENWGLADKNLHETII
jgi:hypothetical protein